MRLILRFLTVLVGASILLLGMRTVNAWFSDATGGPISIATSGSLDLTMSGGPLSVTDLAPGVDYAEMGVFCAKNTGSIDLKFRGLFVSELPGPSNLFQFMTMKVEQQSGETWQPLQEFTGSLEAGPEGLASFFKFSDLMPETENHYIVEGTLSPDQELCYRLSIKLDPITPDDYQNNSLDFVLHLYATQTQNPGWEN